MLAWVPVVATRVRCLPTVYPPQHPPALKLKFWFPFYTIGNSPVPLNVIHSFHICYGVSILSFAWPILMVLSERVQAMMFSEPVDIVPGLRCQACSALCVKQWKLRKTKVLKVKIYCMLIFYRKQVDLFSNGGKLPKVCKKYFFKETYWKFGHLWAKN